MIKLGLLKRDWHFVRPGLEQIKARFDEDWLPEDIYGIIKTGKASLYVCGQAFAVVYPIADEYTGETGVYLLAAHSDEQTPYDDLLKGLDEIARKAGFTFWEMGSRRKGFERRGWEFSHIVYRRKI